MEKNKITLKNANSLDLDDIVKVESEIWPEGTRASRDKFVSRLNIFPEGFFLAYAGKKLIGVSTSERINYNPENLPISWERATDNGYIKNTHNPNGNALYIVSIGAKSRSGGGSALIQAQKELTRRLGLKFLILGARIPGYDKYYKDIKQVEIEEYANMVGKNNEPLDPELRFYTRNGLRILKIVPNYMEDDKESRNYGVLMMWGARG